MRTCDCHLTQSLRPGGIWRFCNKCVVGDLVWVRPGSFVTPPIEIVPNRLKGVKINRDGEAI